MMKARSAVIGTDRRHGHQTARDVDDELHGEEVEGHAVDDEKHRDERAADGAENAARHDRVGLTGTAPAFAEPMQ